jgi:septum site-determining protein MinC
VANAPVSPGAELIADGHVHVYGPLRGRALAGVHGDTTARIFCQSLEAELVSIAGAYRVRDDIDDALIGKPAQIRLKNERIIIDPLTRASK